MLVLLCVVLIGTGYALFRFQPVQTEIEQLEQKMADAQRQIKTTKFPKEPTTNLSALEAQLATLEEEISGKMIELDRLEQQYVPLDNPDALQGIKVNISSLAKKHRVRIRENLPYDPKRGRLASSRSPSKTRTFVGRPGTESFITRFLKGDPYERPLLRLSTESAYLGLRRFIEDLSHLPWRVTIAQYSLEATTSGGADSSTQQISSTLILAL